MSAPDERKAALYARTRRLLAARRAGRIIGARFEDIMRRIREQAQHLEADPDALTRGDRRRLTGASASSREVVPLARQERPTSPP